MTPSSSTILQELKTRKPHLEPCIPSIANAYETLVASYKEGGKLLICGNGGSASDAEHIAGELMKSFLLPRPLDEKEKEAFGVFGDDGDKMAGMLQKALPCIPLVGHNAISTAFCNDVAPEYVFAQQVYGLGNKQDVFLGISTSGNAANVHYAAMAAKAKGMQVIGLTGGTGGKLKAISDVLILSPHRETFLIQEDHLPIYHALCAMLEAAFFSKE